MLSGPCGGRDLSHTVISGAAYNVNMKRAGELIQFGYLEFRMPTGSAVVEVAQIADSSLCVL